MPFLLKRLLFRLHWLLGLVAGLVIALVGFTGALIAYEEELLHALNPQLVLEPAGRERLAPDALIARAAQQHPDFDVRSFAAQRAPAAPVEVRLGRGAERGGPRVLLDPYSGELLPLPRGTGFFETSEQLHRNLASGPVGKQIVGASTIALIVLALSGVVLRWPRRWGSPRAWLRLDLALRGRNLLWHLHAVAGTWCLAFYLLAALTGLWWSYEGYRNFVNGLAGVPAQGQRPGPPGAAGAPGAAAGIATPRATPPPLDLAHAAFLAAAPEAVRYQVALPPTAQAPLEWRYFRADAPHSRAAGTLRMDPLSGAVLARQAYAELPAGRRFVASMLPLHTGEWFGGIGRAAMALASLLMPLFAITGYWLWLQRRRRAGAARATAAASAEASDLHPVAVLHASQSGTAERLAHLTARWLREAGLAARVQPLAQWEPSLAGGAPALFVVASYGEGDPPDAALPFARRWLRGAALPDLRGLSCAVLALGNRRYDRFCGFGRDLADWLERTGAQALSATVESHEGEPGSLQHWREALGRRWPALAATAALDDASIAPWSDWTLTEHARLNPLAGSAPLCDLRLRPAAAMPDWQPGDLLELPGPDGVPRAYSLASLPAQGEARLLVRRFSAPDGSAGGLSPRLCDDATPGERLQARVKRAAGFPPPASHEAALLIANGVGVAPFLALLARGDVAFRWLVYGERDPQHDAGLLEELTARQRAGGLQRLDLAWSRGPSPAYVQDVLRGAGGALREFVAAGAAIRVCGSPQMGDAVDRELRAQLGETAIEALLAAGRYRRELF